MKNLLQLHTSIFSSAGHSSQLAAEFVSAWQSKHPDTQVTFRDLGAESLAHLDLQCVAAFSIAPELLTPEQQTFLLLADQLIAEIQQAELIVLGVPMYNFGIPSTLKVYFDYIARAGVTFQYTENGPVGLLTGKKAIVFLTRGGIHAGTRLDTQTGYVQNFLNFLGINEVEFVYAEGLNKGESCKETSLSKAKLRLVELVA